MSSAYDNVVRRPFKFKGEALPDLAEKKKKKKRKAANISLNHDDDRTFASSSSSSVIADGQILTGEELARLHGADREEQEAREARTFAEQSVDEKKAKREAEIIKKLAAKPYRQRLEEYNERIANESEHFDIPKVGPG